MKLKKDVFAFDIVMIITCIVGTIALYPSINIVFPLLCGVFGFGNLIYCRDEWLING